MQFIVFEKKYNFLDLIQFYKVFSCTFDILINFYKKKKWKMIISFDIPHDFKTVLIHLL